MEAEDVGGLNGGDVEGRFSMGVLDAGPGTGCEEKLENFS